MFKKLLFTILSFSILTMFGQSDWNKEKINDSDDVVFAESHMPSQFQLYSINLEEIQSQLQYVELKGEVSVQNSSTLLSFPNENGAMEQFKMLEWSIFEPGLAEQFPMIKTYVGQSVKNPGTSLTMSIGTDGLHLMFKRPGKSAMFLDPYTRDRSKYILYTKNNMPLVEGEFNCHFENEEPSVDYDFNEDFQQRSQDGKLRTYRLAVACTIEYSQYHLTNQGVSSGASLTVKKAAVMSAITNTINRVAGIYRLELGVDFALVTQNQNIVFIISDNFSNNNPNALINESQSVITSAIGVGVFDVGHTFSTGGGGLAGKGVICYSNAKASGITGRSQPIGDAYDIDYVAHELGHQFGCDHTFNTNTGTNACGAQRNASTAGEPGGGSTIMAYAGICGATPNVQNNSDAYFHYFSLKQAYDRIRGVGEYNGYPTCGSLMNTGNVEPTAIAGPDVTIPKGTAFVLKGQSTDDSSTPLFCWEQIDTQFSQEGLSSTATQGPSYRTLTPTAEPNRFMPKFETVLGGSLQTQWEVTPTVGRAMHFALTTRDYDMAGGQTNVDLKTVNVSNSAGPFVVTSQAASETWNTGESKTITWNVANTTTFGVNASTVKISLVDLDGSELAVLAASAMNDGSETITVPSLVDDSVRIMIMGNDTFYAINSADLSINATASCTSLCSSSGRTGAGASDGTTLVQFNTINNTSSGSPAYTDFKSISTTVERGSTHNLTVKTYTAGPYTEFVRVWIDWNANCVFEPATEQYDLGSITNTPSTAGAEPSDSPKAITIPLTATLGSVIMRVTSSYNQYQNSCDSNFYGEVEDYTLTIDSAAAVNDVSNFDNFILSPNPNEGNFNISLQSDSNKVSVKVYDMIGRQIYTKDYDNNQIDFNANVNLNNVQQGMYLVHISDGTRSTSEKIIIK